ncbi:4-diphosphocytidyl-2-C-methyl-D-erythritol kinase [Microlunatus sagamiharensis]|uniref:4-diphosphocytidyl-2-C-methyl-D-erythritol kinase n=1 Tax=Microlunatus sagamiharensis TaxID=546874 RepID=A0A1H2MW73_9ACTN|nr:4-(cytidine 5'-diphospho)-2-C-methyl-D-erythritol kinase [Microlunatus sagamiharensis]SDU97185.1 4-diphosphocytidyl-2-C-methyl-D-erythritol kinase [Microlunatus sagamiharensis]
MASPLPPAPVGVHVRAPAKINLALKVGAPRPDGYHPLATVYHAVSLYDDVHAEWAEPDEFELEASGEGVEQVPLDDSNLALRAARLLARTHGGGDRLGVHLTIRKNIPVAGGLAGGSADGAAALLACATLWDIDLAPEVLRHLGAELGSDVPFSLMGGTAVGSGRGEDVAPALARGSYHWVLAFGQEGLSTPAVYRRFDELNPSPEPPEVPADLMNALRGGDPYELGAALVNDLQPAALTLRPQLRRVLDAGLDLGAVGAVVSGSGPTCAFLVEDEEDAVDLSIALSAEGVARKVMRAGGPVVGARVVG